MSSREPLEPALDATGARDGRAEAQRVVGPALAARVLEPSPPAVRDEWFADDPVLRGQPDAGPATATAPVVAPVAGPWITWDAWLSDHPDHRAWASARWLGAFRRLRPAPETVPATRRALHHVAVSVLAPARRRVNGKIGLRYTYRGFGTPFFGDDEQVRVVGDELVRQRGDGAVAEPVTTLAAAASLALGGPPDRDWAARLDVPAPVDPDEPLHIDPNAAEFLGDWYGFAFSVLEELRIEPASADASRVQLWPEHFDAAFDCLPDATGRRATFGVSPGDADVDEPYLYVTPWHADAISPGPSWNATTFVGAILRWRELAGASDQRGGALEFFRRRRDELLG
jgi:hypothetical protein